jgi:SAM-dependent MidA family methyltransferase
LSLRELIADEICRSGPIPFSRYMELCLYHPELGYYSRAEEKFGKSGDFYTSSDVHAVFGRLIGRQFEEMWRALGSPAAIDLVELGPGRGLFAGDVLDWCKRMFPDFARALRYVLVEQSAGLRRRLEGRLSEHLTAGKAIILRSLEEAAEIAGKNLIVFANEFFDALPVEIIDYRGAVRVCEAGGKFSEQFVPASARESDFLDRYSVHPCEGQRIEVSLQAAEWMQRIANALKNRHGFAIFIDYGYTREQQRAGRFFDTLMTYRKHSAGHSPYQNPGEEDITAHVNFTALRETAVAARVEWLGLVTQSQFLMGIGEETQFADAFQLCNLPQERAKVALQLKHLISPEGMGEIFQVLVLSHQAEKEKAARLSGLRFGRSLS